MHFLPENHSNSSKCEGSVFTQCSFLIGTDCVSTKTYKQIEKKTPFVLPSYQFLKTPKSPKNDIFYLEMNANRLNTNATILKLCP